MQKPFGIGTFDSERDCCMDPPCSLIQGKDFRSTGAQSRRALFLGKDSYTSWSSCCSRCTSSFQDRGGHASPCIARIPLLSENYVLLLDPAAVRRVSITTKTSACFMKLSQCSIQELTLRLRIFNVWLEVSLV